MPQGTATAAEPWIRIDNQFLESLHGYSRHVGARSLVLQEDPEVPLLYFAEDLLTMREWREPQAAVYGIEPGNANGSTK